VPTKEYFRIRRADLWCIGRQLWKAMEKTPVVGRQRGDGLGGLKDPRLGHVSMNPGFTNVSFALNPSSPEAREMDR
jgi:hypothetical protein